MPTGRLVRALLMIIATTALVACAASDESDLGTEDRAGDRAEDPASTNAPTTADSTTTTPVPIPTTVPTTTVPIPTTVPATTVPIPTTTVPTTTVPTTTVAATTTLAPSPISPCPPTGAAVWEERPAVSLPEPTLPSEWRTRGVGTSVQGRGITALYRPVDEPGRVVLVIGGIHGNEPVSPPAVRAMTAVDLPPDLELWLVPLLNPDGAAAGRRCNADGVDLNRNFAWRWRPSTGGPGPFSEPESVAARELVLSLEPDLVVWVHQPLDYVSSIGVTPDGYERAWSAGSGLPVRPDVSQHGGGESWTAFEAGIPSMLVEAAGWEATPDMVAAQVAGLERLLDVVVPR